MPGVGIIQWDKVSEGALRGCYAATRAALAVDDPDGPPMSAQRLREVLTDNRGTERKEVWFASGAGGDADVLGWYRLKLPDRENRGHGMLRLVVHPAHRRRGVGTELLRHAAGRAARDGRSYLGAETLQGTAGEAFAAHAGARAGVLEARRVLGVAALPAGKVASLRASATTAAAGYSLVTWTGRTPDEHVDGLAYVAEAMNDAPSDYEAERWDAQRVREEVDARIEASAHRVYTVVAIHNATGQLAALTAVEVDPEFPDWGFQEGTMVARPHRGHRLGMLVKTAMLDWLATAEPALRRIETGNAAGNKYMIAINEELGFELVHPWWQEYVLPVIAMLGG
jgi:RimJ/RimL family protein N-acetyltransferase